MELVRHSAGKRKCRSVRAETFRGLSFEPLSTRMIVYVFSRIHILEDMYNVTKYDTGYLHYQPFYGTLAKACRG